MFINTYCDPVTLWLSVLAHTSVCAHRAACVKWVPTGTVGGVVEVWAPWLVMCSLPPDAELIGVRVLTADLDWLR